MLLFAVERVVRAGDLHGKSEITEAARQVAFHENVAGVQVSMDDRE